MNNHPCVHLRKLELYFFHSSVNAFFPFTRYFLYTHTFILSHSLLRTLYVEIKYVSGHIDKIIIYNKQVKL